MNRRLGRLRPVPLHAGVLVIRNLTNDDMSLGYFVNGGGSRCLASLEVPPSGTVPANAGTSRIARIKVTRARDALVHVRSPQTSADRGDRQLFIRLHDGGFALQAQ